MNHNKMIDDYSLMLDKYSLMVSSMYLSDLDLFFMISKKNYQESQLIEKEDMQAFKKLSNQLVDLKLNAGQQPTSEQMNYVKGLQNIYGQFELTSQMLAIIQLIFDLGNYIKSWDICFNYPNDNAPLLKACPELLVYLDRRYKIFSLTAVELLGDFEFGFGNYTFNIHPFIPYEFNRKLHKILDISHTYKKGSISLALQTGTYIPKDRYLSHFLEDYYRGPKFSKNILNNKDGVTEYWRHTDDKESLKSKYINAFFKKYLKRTEFMWSTKDSTKDFVIEELVAPETTDVIDGENYICVKYIHTQFSLVNGKCIHFDGCMNIYDSESYQKRLGTNIDNRSGAKAKKHMKLFRIDGENIITNDEWVLLAGAFFKNNELVQEYFGYKLPWEKV